jgi:hypothetical protein
MAIKSQIRLQQLTGSLAALKPANLIRSGSGVLPGSAPGADLEDVLEYYSQAVAQISGDVNFGASAPGSFLQDIYPILPSSSMGRWVLGLTAGGAPTGTSPTMVYGAQTFTPATVSLVCTTCPVFAVNDVITIVDLAAAEPFAHQYISFTVLAINTINSNISVRYNRLSNSASMASGDVGITKLAADIAKDQWFQVRTSAVNSNTMVVVESGLAGAASDISLVSNKGVDVSATENAVDSITLQAQHADGGVKIQIGALGSQTDVLAVVAAGVTATGTLGVTGVSTLAAVSAAALDTSGIVNLNSTTDATNSTSGALIIDGGVGMAKDLFIGENLDVTGTSALDGLVTMGGSATIATDLDVSGDTSLLTLDSSGATSLATGGGAVTLASAGAVTTVEGTLNVDQAVTFDATLGVVGISSLASITGSAGLRLAGDLDANSISNFADTAVFSKASGLGLQVTADASIGAELVVGTDLLLTTDAKKIELGASVGKKLTLTQTAAGANKIDSGVSLEFGAATLHEFSGAHIGSGFGGGTRGVAMALSGEGASFLTAMGDVSIMKAIENNKASISGGAASEYLFSGSVVSSPAAVVLYQRAGGGTAQDLRTAGYNALDVFVNGQRMMSSSAGSSGDYIVRGDGPASLTLQFDLQADDVVQVIDRQ